MKKVTGSSPIVQGRKDIDTGSKTIEGQEGKTLDDNWGKTKDTIVGKDFSGWISDASGW